MPRPSASAAGELSPAQRRWINQMSEMGDVYDIDAIYDPEEQREQEGFDMDSITSYEDRVMAMSCEYRVLQDLRAGRYSSGPIPAPVRALPANRRVVPFGRRRRMRSLDSLSGILLPLPTSVQSSTETQQVQQQQDPESLALALVQEMMRAILQRVESFAQVQLR